jgi:hypothetical protein
MVSKHVIGVCKIFEASDSIHLRPLSHGQLTSSDATGDTLACIQVYAGATPWVQLRNTEVEFR